MKSRLVLLSIFVASILFVTCKKDPEPVVPTACFTVSSNEVDTGQVVAMNASCSVNAQRYEWSFDDSTTASGVSVSHAWHHYGNHAASLTVYSSDNTTASIASTINVDPRYRFAGTYNVTQSCGIWINPYVMTVSLYSGGGVEISNFNGINWNVFSTSQIFANTTSINVSTNALVDSNNKHWDVSGLATLSGNTLTFSYFVDNLAYYAAESVPYTQYSCNAVGVKQ